MNRSAPMKRTPLAPGKPLTRKAPIGQGNGLKRPEGKRKPQRDRGFTPATKLLIRKRAGNGEARNARCEACGIWLGEHCGQVQHIQARQMGGSRLRNRPSNGVLLCGTPQSLCHGACERRSEHMRAQGFWRLSSDPAGPVMLHGGQGGVTVWLDDLGGYSLTAPEGRDAA